MSSIHTDIVVVTFDARAITGTVSTEDNDSAFTSRGVRYVDPKSLNSFAAIRQAAHTALLRLGTRFLSGYAISAEKADLAAEIMNKKKSQWEEAAQKFLGGYYELVEEWVKAHPEVQPFRSLFPDIGWVKGRIGFEWTMFSIEPRGLGEQGMRQMIGRLPAQIIAEIVQDVRSSWDPSARKMTAKTRGILKRVTEKLSSLSFLGGQLGQMAAKLQRVLEMLPTEGQFSPSEMATASMVLAMLSSEDSAQNLLTLDPDRLGGLETQSASAAAPSFTFEEEPVAAEEPQHASGGSQPSTKADDEFFVVFG